MKDGFGNLMQQAQQLQENMQKAQEQLADLKVEGNAGGGMVRVYMNGLREVSKVDIDTSATQDIEMLEDLVAAAFNDALRRVEECTREKFDSMTAGLGTLPSGFKLPF
ncbi:MAG: YbaB/EbfC family nucleoid-associated protein [Gammaproteobacteria bacterium]